MQREKASSTKNLFYTLFVTKKVCKISDSQDKSLDYIGNIQNTLKGKFILYLK